MAWKDGGWKYRIPIAIDNSTPSALVDVQIPIPEDFDLFWDTIDTAGDELRITQADGITDATYQLGASPAWSKANRTGIIELDGFTADGTDAGVVLGWLYWGLSGAGNGEGSFTVSTPVNGYLHMGAPAILGGGQRPIPGSSRPERRIQKTVGERIYIWFELRNQLERRSRKYAKKFFWEEVQRVVSTISTGGSTTPTSTMAEAASTRFVETPAGAFYVGVIVKAGTTATDYTIEPVIKTFAPEITIDTGALVQGQYRTLEPRALLRVEDIDED